MAWDIEIGGVSRKASIHRPTGVAIDLLWNERATARFSCVPGYLPDMHDEVVIYAQDGTTPIFGGIVYGRESRGLTQGEMLTDIVCVDWSIYFDWRTVTDGYVGTAIDISSSSGGSPTTITTAIAHGLVTGDTVYIEGHSIAAVNGSHVVTVTGSTTFTIAVAGGGGATGTMQRTTVVSLKRVLQDLIAYYLTDYGITLDASQVDGPSGSHPGLTWKRKKVSELLHDLTTYSGGYLWSISPTKVLAMALPGVSAAPFALTDNSPELIDLDWAEDSDNYATRIILVCGGTDTLATRQSWTVDAGHISAGYLETDVPSIPTGGVEVTVNGSLKTIGGAGSELEWDWRTHRITAGTYTPQIGDVVVLSYTAQYPFVVTEDSGDPVPVERVIDAPDIKELVPAQTMAAALLAEANQTPRRLTARVKASGLAPGQELTVNLPGRGTTGTAVITALSIDIMPDREDTHIYTARAISGAYQGNELDYFRGLGGGAAAVRSGIVPGFTSGANPVVISTGVALGGATAQPVHIASAGTYTRAVNVLPFVATRTGVGLVNVELWAKAASVGVIARLRDLTTPDWAGAPSSTITSQSPTLTSFTVSLVAGRRYELHLTSDTSGADVYGIASMDWI